MMVCDEETRHHAMTFVEATHQSHHWFVKKTCYVSLSIEYMYMHSILCVSPRTARQAAKCVQPGGRMLAPGSCCIFIKCSDHVSVTPFMQPGKQTLMMLTIVAVTKARLLFSDVVLLGWKVKTITS